MAYFYSGHMGGLYTSDEYLNWEDLYCEQCGDSDTLIGSAETFEEAWELIGPTPFEGCTTCESRETGDCGYCEPFECEGNMSLDSVMKFLDEEYPEKKLPVVYLIPENDVNGTICLEAGKDRAKFLQSPCYKPEEYAKYVLQSFRHLLDNADMNSLQCIGDINTDGRRRLIYTIKDRTKDPEEGLSYYGDLGWVGWLNLSEVNLSEDCIPVMEAYKAYRGQKT